ncbi:chemotaxis protein CheA [Parvibium lacunae]|uniref:Chemotaxis protein CheA n=1 Tax=Parvibium lacunae TaxID=1888893 RepID=A0A368KYB6_9BURK|nr:chemotaxis protein CheA [Parvibium lacunae]RCS56446.1 chemotaxis protein CheA [Parvibium lacunae]
MSDSSIDLSQFYAVFFEEAFEHLDNMEHLLLEIDVAAPDDEDLNAIFRAAHSIKGGSGTFGFTQVAAFTHVLENLLDKIRKHEIALTTPMVDCFLQCGDATRQQLEAYRDDGEQPDVKHLVVSLQAFIDANKLAQDNTHGLPELGLKVTVQLPESGLSQAAKKELFADLLMLGKVHDDPQGSASNVLSFYLITQTPADEVQSLVAFMTTAPAVDVITLAVEEIQQQLAQDSAYGMFDAETAITEMTASGEGYGFFTPIEPSTTNAENSGYGFFDETVSPTHTQVAPTKEPQGLTTEDSSYGFFEPLGSPSQPSTSMEVLPPVAATDAIHLAQSDFSQKNAAIQTDKPQDLKTTQAATKKSATTAADNASIRVGIDKVDQLINLVGEVVITQAMVMAQASKHLDVTVHEAFFARLAELERNTRDLQEAVMSVRMLPISSVFNRFPRMLRDLAAKLGKQMELKMIGEHTELDKGLVELITDPLTHLVRNSLDHGIEMPEARLAAGKNPIGTITLSAFHRGGNIIIQVQDDGGGLRRDKLIEKAREKGISIASDAPDSEVWQLIFAPGFSTAEKITDISGRGVGMDVVRKNILALNGTIELDSVPGQGTRTTIRLPLTLAIMDGMSIAVGGEIYVVALGSVVESIQLQPGAIKTVSGQGRVIDVRAEYLPVVDLREIFPVTDMPARAGQDLVVIVESEGLKIALLVDELVGQQQVVVKSLESNYRKVDGISGATIMGDGRVAMILDVAALVKKSAQAN